MPVGVAANKFNDVGMRVDHRYMPPMAMLTCKQKTARIVLSYIVTVGLAARTVGASEIETFESAHIFITSVVISI